MPSVVDSHATKEEHSKRWGDEEEAEELPPPQETIDENGVKTTIEYKLNDKGQRVKITRKYRLYKTVTRYNKRVEERKKWKKFGDCAGLPPGPESGITSIGEEVFITLGTSQQREEEKKDVSSVPSTVTCRTCLKVGDHYTLKCPYKMALPGAAENSNNNNDEQPKDGAPSTSKYVPPNRRGQGRLGEDGDDNGTRRKDEGSTVRVTNLSEETKESDLQELFRPFGPISRVYLAKDKITNLSRGFAFINFVHHDDAARAIDKLSGFGYDHLILHLEWAKPSK